MAQECQHYSQPGDSKENCRKHNIIYDNIFKQCNPDEEDRKREKHATVEDRRNEASIYV